MSYQPLKMDFGRFELTFCNSGYFKLDGGAMFSVVPKVIWNRTNPADERNRIQLGTFSLLIDDGKRKILVETGCGDKIDEKFRDIYAIERTNAVKGVEQAGVTPKQIDVVINTHLHFDHAGGNTVLDAKGAAVPAFPNAEYICQQREWDWAQAPSPRDRASYLPDDFLPVERAGQLRFVEGEQELFPGVTVIPTPGHNDGHQSVLITDRSRQAIYGTDLFPTATHLHLPYIMSYDLYPLRIMQTKEQILGRAVSENWQVLFYHDPEIRHGSIQQDKNGRYGLATYITNNGDIHRKRLNITG
jgi:glyoxylase-like metal-dependent hydrolase (beta-lactamase superfamily II)